MLHGIKKERLIGKNGYNTWVLEVLETVKAVHCMPIKYSLRMFTVGFENC